MDSGSQPKNSSSTRKEARPAVGLLPIVRFIKLIKILPNGCWEWQGTTTTDMGYGKYGKFRFNGKYGLAHVWAYGFFVGTLIKGMEVHHVCEYKRCVNPQHLDQLTKADHRLLGNDIAMQNARKTHCKHGHKFTPENLIVRSDGYRECLTCSRAIKVRWYLKNRTLKTVNHPNTKY